MHEKERGAEMKDRGLIILDSLSRDLRTLMTQPGVLSDRYHAIDIAWRMASDIAGARRLVAFGDVFVGDDPSPEQTAELAGMAKAATKQLRTTNWNVPGLFAELSEMLGVAVSEFQPLGKYPEAYEIETHLQDHMELASVAEFLTSEGFDVSKQADALGGINADCIKTINWWNKTNEESLESWRTWWGIAPEDKGPATFILDLQRSYTRWGIAYPPYWAK